MMEVTKDLIEPQAVGWEYFCDAAYFDMWCVRRIGERTFGQGFHVLNHDSAKALAGELARIEAKAAAALTTATAEADALKERAKRAEDGWTEAVNQNAALRAEVEAKNDLLRECLRWLPLLDSHEAGSTTDLLCDRIRAILEQDHG